MTKTDDQLIAEFMGLQVYQTEEEMRAMPLEKLSRWILPEQAAYSHNWSWLMPVVKKISSLGYDFHIVMNNRYTMVRVRDIGGEPIITMATHDIMNDVYLAAIALIKHHKTKSGPPDTAPGTTPSHTPATPPAQE